MLSVQDLEIAIASNAKDLRLAENNHQHFEVINLIVQRHSLMATYAETLNRELLSARVQHKAAA